MAIGDKIRASETILAYLPLEKSDVPDDENNGISTNKSLAELTLKSRCPSATCWIYTYRSQHNNTIWVDASIWRRSTIESRNRKIKSWNEQARQAVAQADAEIAQLKAQAEQARLEVERAKAAAEAEMAKLKAETRCCRR